MILGGVRIPDTPGLAGHSDGDAIAHAVIDAILGAGAVGDVGTHFPPGQEAWRDADSMDLLARAVRILAGKGLGPSNVDVVVICERPRIAPVAPAIRARLAEVLGLPFAAVSVKGKTNEGMGWIGSGEGLAVHAVAMVGKLEL
jgi:2-C-methyl-D-erythritol 2,4-cyclodiphosphate synthase